MNGYINTRPLFEAISKIPYVTAMERRTKKLGITDYYTREKPRNSYGTGRGKISFFMSLENWNKIKETLEEV